MSGGGGGKSEDVTIGYRYYMGLHFAICYGPVDALTQVVAGDREAWSGSVTGNWSVSINKPDLFGGEKKEGGIAGTLHVMMGGPSQGVNSYLSSKLGAGIPAYRGVLSAVFNGMVSAMTPYIKPWAFKVRRITQGWHGGAWYSSKAAIGADMNPAHIVYEVLTNPEWGMGYPSNLIDDAAFRAAADALHAEGFGLSMIWNQSDKIKSFLQLVMSHIGAVLSVDRKTGLFVLKLVRGDYNIADLPVIDPNNATLESWQRAAWGETANEITVVYTDTSNGKQRAVTVQDLANIDLQGAIINQRKNYVGITSSDLAQRVAMRDLQQASTPLTKAKVKLNRDGWGYAPGDVVRLQWPVMGIDAAFRVLAVNWGTLQDNSIAVDLAEDIFGLPQSAYTSQEPIGWVEPANPPAASPTRYLTETPYFDLARTLSAADLAYLDPTDCRLDVFAVRPSGDALDYDLWTAAGSATLAQKGSGSHPVTATTASAIVREETSTILCTDLSGLDDDPPATGGYIIINGEYMRLDSYSIAANTLTVSRGVLDTVPAAHALGSRVWFASNSAGRDFVDYLPSDVVKVKCQTKTWRGELDIASAPEDTYTMLQRQNRPYPPGKVRINGAAYPASSTASLSVTWAHRDRLTQTAGIIPQGDNSIGPEAGTTYNVRVYDPADALITSTNTSGTSFSYTLTATLALLHFEGTNGSSTFNDDTGRSWTRSGNAQISTAQFQYGAASGLFDGTGDYVITNHSAVLNGAGDFTVECWIRPNVNNAQKCIVRKGSSTFNSGWQLYMNASGQLVFGYADGTGAMLCTGTTTIPTGVWTHVAGVRSGNDLKVFVGGVLETTITMPRTPANNIVDLYLGRDTASSSRDYSGNMDEFRVSNVARYSASFTPAGPFALSGDAPPASVRIEIESVRGGLTSWTKHNIPLAITV